MTAMSSQSTRVARDTPASRRRRHWEMLAIALFVVIAAALLRVQDDGRVALAASPALRLPPLCGTQAMFGISCPACGLTRSVVRLAEGDVQRSLAAHRLGWLMAALILLQIPYRVVALRTRDLAPLGTRLPRVIGWALIAALIGNWLIGIGLFGNGLFGNGPIGNGG